MPSEKVQDSCQYSSQHLGARFWVEKWWEMGGYTNLQDFLNPLPGPKSRSAVCGYCRPWPFTLLIYSYV